jgi:hypothetical protein
MKLPRDVSGRLLSDALSRHWGYRKIHQTGSHFVPETGDPFHQRLAIPDHAALRIGTFHSLLRTVAGHKGVSRDAVLASL